MKNFFLFLFFFLFITPAFAQELDLRLSSSWYTWLFYDELVYENFKDFQDKELFIFAYIYQVDLPQDISRSERKIFLTNNTNNIEFLQNYSETEAQKLFTIIPLTSKNLNLDITQLVDEYQGHDFIVIIKPYMKIWNDYYSAWVWWNIFSYYLSPQWKYLYFSDLTQETIDGAIISDDRLIQFISKLQRKLNKLSVTQRDILKQQLLERLYTWQQKNYNNFRKFLAKNINSEQDVESSLDTINSYKSLEKLIVQLLLICESIDVNTGIIQIKTFDQFMNDLEKELDSYIQ